MSKKPNISKEAQVLLKLLRIALGTEPRKYFGEVVEPFPEGIDWKEVVRLSYEHKVSAIAVDGLEASKYDPYKGLCFDGLSNRFGQTQVRCVCAIYNVLTFNN